MKKAWLRKSIDSISAFIILMGFLYAVGQSFLFADKMLMAWGITDNFIQSAMVWYAVGVLCALFWPLKYKRGMKGHWRAAGPHLVLLSFTGPWALLLGIPL